MLMPETAWALTAPDRQHASLFRYASPDVTIPHNKLISLVCLKRLNAL